MDILILAVIASVVAYFFVPKFKAFVDGVIAKFKSKE